jgi:hypothetical protein
VYILSRNNNENSLNALSSLLETLRQKAISTKDKKDWRIFYNLYNAFLTPVDLVFNDRVIKRKSLDYGYCISAHRSQGSTYGIVIIDMENIKRCKNINE